MGEERSVFVGFCHASINIDGVEIAYASAGEGPPLLLLHGYPQNRFMWSRVAPILARRFTVVCPDLRGYGDSAKPAAGPESHSYSFRAMAADQVGLMEHLGHRCFMVAGHDRGGRVAHRMARDCPDRVAALAVLDLVPTLKMYEDVTRNLAQTYWQWYFLPQPAPFPERMIGADPDYYFEHCLGSNGGAPLEAFDPRALAEYRRCWNDPAMIHASCNDYRAGIGIDLEHDARDQGRLLECPVLALWAADGIMQRLFDIGAEWRAVARDVSTATVPGGHFFLDHQPEASARILGDFFANCLQTVPQA